MLDLGELLLHIRADTSDAEKSVSGIGDKLKSGLGGAATAVVGAVTAATAAVGAFAASSVSVGMSFDSAMSQVAATMGKTTDEIQNLRDFALEMGSTTAFSASEAAEALNYMALAGYNADQSMEMLPNVLNLAAAGGMDLATASDMVTDAQSALGLTMEETTVMVDQMAKTSSTTNTSVQQLGEAILRIGATGKTVAGGTAELNQVLGLLADNGIKGAEGGTKLRNVIMSLQTPTDKGAAALEQLGISTYDAEGNFRSLADIMPELSVALDDLTMEQRQAAISAIFNKTDIAAVNALLETTPERWNEVATAIDNAKGSAEQMAETQLDNLEGDIIKFKSALEGAQIAISDRLTPTLREFTQFGTEAVSKLSEAFKEGGLNGAMEALGTILSEGLNKLVSALPQWIDAGMKLLGAVGQGILDNLPTIVSAALQIVTTIVEGIIQALPHIAQGAIQIITQLATGLGEALPQLIPMAAQAIKTFVEGLAEPGNMSNLVHAAGDLIKGLVKGLTEALPTLIECVPLLISALVEAIISSIPEILECGVQIIAGLIKGIMSAITQIPAAIKAVFDGIVNGIKSLFGIHSPSTVMAEIGKYVIEGMLQGISNAWHAITDFFSGAISNVISFVSDGWNKLKEKTAQAWDTIKEKTGQLKEKVQEHWNNLKDKVVETASNLKDKAVDTWNNMKDKVQEVTSNLKDKVSETWSNLKDKVSETVSNLKDKVSETWNNLKDKVSETANNLKEKVTTTWSNLKDKVSETTNNLKEKVTTAWSNVKETVGNTVENLKTAVSDKFNNMKQNIADRMSNIKDDIKNKWDTAVNTLKSVDLASIGSGLINNFKSGLQNAWGAVTSWVSNAASSIKNTISNAINWVSSKVSGKHRTGLNEVPYDGYIAELHQGERVLTAAEANQYDKYRQGQQAPQTNQTIIKFEGNYQFRDQQDIDYFMGEAGKLIKRKVG